MNSKNLEIYSYSAILHVLKDDLEFIFGLTFMNDLCLQYYPPKNTPLYIFRTSL